MSGLAGCGDQAMRRIAPGCQSEPAPGGGVPGARAVRLVCHWALFDCTDLITEPRLFTTSILYAGFKFWLVVAVPVACALVMDRLMVPDVGLGYSIRPFKAIWLLVLLYIMVTTFE